MKVEAGACAELGSEPERFRLGYQSCLDGLRGVAILGVLVYHANGAYKNFGPIGVDIFFVLSGFLITCLLIEEWDEFQSISLKAFYMRRVLRLLPALVAMLAIMAGFQWAFSPRVAALQTTRDTLIALFYSSNWAIVLGFTQLAFPHTWSLSIEEQFYLTWPMLLFVLLRRTTSRSSVLAWILLGFFLILLEKVIIRLVAPRGAVLWLQYATEVRADALMIGCALAVVFTAGLFPETWWWKKALPCAAWGVAVPGLVLLSFWDVPTEFYLVVFHSIVAVLVATVMAHLLTDTTGALNGLLSQSWLVYVGKISYGLYLWHLPIFTGVQVLRWNPFARLTLEFALTAVATLASYYLLESPVLRWKRRFAPCVCTSSAKGSCMSLGKTE
jgi:peptidoglycan/LPS O-acetylase OafA/YrhL